MFRNPGYLTNIPPPLHWKLHPEELYKSKPSGNQSLLLHKFLKMGGLANTPHDVILYTHWWEPLQCHKFILRKCRYLREKLDEYPETTVLYLLPEDNTVSTQLELFTFCFLYTCKVFPEIKNDVSTEVASKSPCDLTLLHMFANNSYRRIPYLTEYCRKHLLGSIWEDELDSDDEKSDLIRCSPSLYCDPERLGAKTWIHHLYDGKILCDQIPEHNTFRKQFIRAHGYQLMEELEKDCRQVTIELCKKYPAFVDDVSREALLDNGTASWLESLLGGVVVVKRLEDRFRKTV